MEEDEEGEQEGASEQYTSGIATAQDDMGFDEEQQQQQQPKGKKDRSKTTKRTQRLRREPINPNAIDAMFMPPRPSSPGSIAAAAGRAAAQRSIASAKAAQLSREAAARASTAADLSRAEQHRRLADPDGKDGSRKYLPSISRYLGSTDRATTVCVQLLLRNCMSTGIYHTILNFSELPPGRFQYCD